MRWYPRRLWHTFVHSANELAEFDLNEINAVGHSDNYIVCVISQTLHRHTIGFIDTCNPIVPIGKGSVEASFHFGQTFKHWTTLIDKLLMVGDLGKVFLQGALDGQQPEVESQWFAVPLRSFLLTPFAPICSVLSPILIITWGSCTTWRPRCLR